jgi:D-glycero-D-manno-heptose 1,7-bisphosphate phosphatase
MQIRPAVFLDRDGVLIEDIHLLKTCDQVKIFDYVPGALRRLKNAGYLLVVVTNQTVVARGLVSECAVKAIHEFIQGQLLENDGCGVDRFYFCPHHPNATVERYRQDCECRKPRPGMILQAAQELNLDLKKSWLVGDRVSDIIAGQSAGCKTILIETGMHLAPVIESSYSSDFSGEPDFVCVDLADAVDVILREKE